MRVKRLSFYKSVTECSYAEYIWIFSSRTTQVIIVSNTSRNSQAAALCQAASTLLQWYLGLSPGDGPRIMLYDNLQSNFTYSRPHKFQIWDFRSSSSRFASFVKIFGLCRSAMSLIGRYSINWSLQAPSTSSSPTCCQGSLSQVTCMYWRGSHGAPSKWSLVPAFVGLYLRCRSASLLLQVDAQIILAALLSSSSFFGTCLQSLHDRSCMGLRECIFHLWHF